MSKFNNVIAMLQEPYVNNKKNISNCPARYDIFPNNRTGHRRTAIFASRHLKLTEINELCTPNQTTIGGVINDAKIVFASINMHYDRPVVTEDMIALVSYCRKNSFQLIICADSNSHSTLWGPTAKVRCKRGEALEEWIL